MLPLTTASPIHDTTADPAVAKAVADLRIDIGRRIGTSDAAGIPITVAIDPAIGASEHWQLRISDDGVAITGSDRLGVIHGIYQFSYRHLGIEPFWFWIDQTWEQVDAVRLNPGRVTASPGQLCSAWLVHQ